MILCAWRLCPVIIAEAVTDDKFLWRSRDVILMLTFVRKIVQILHEWPHNAIIVQKDRKIVAVVQMLHNNVQTGINARLVSDLL